MGGEGRTFWILARKSATTARRAWANGPSGRVVGRAFHGVHDSALAAHPGNLPDVPEDRCIRVENPNRPKSLMATAIPAGRRISAA